MLSRVQSLPYCSNFEACGLLQFGFPPPPATTTEEPGSGEGSGEEPLIYDENLYARAIHPPNPDNYTSVQTYELCRCSNDTVCPGNDTSQDEASRVRLDAFLSLSFCKPVKELFPHPCRGKRALTRVFGKLGVTNPDPMLTTTMSDYVKTRIYCHCPHGTYEKMPKIESWPDETYAYLYHCT